MSTTKNFPETSTTKTLPLVSVSKGFDLFCKFEMTFTCSKSVEKGSYHDRDFLVIARNELDMFSSKSHKLGYFPWKLIGEITGIEVFSPFLHPRDLKITQLIIKM